MKYLNESTIQGIAWHIKQISSNKIIVISGAGLSVPAGIPDFRSTDVGLYHVPFDDDCYFRDVFSRSYFLRRPQPLYALLRHILLQTYRPTLSHCFIALLENKNLLLRNYSLNMDCLEKEAGVSDSKFVPINGTFFDFSCSKCNEVYDSEWTSERISAGRMPQCKRCGGWIMAQLTFSGDPLPALFYQRAGEDFPECELLIILGTTLSSEPVASILGGFDENFPRLFLNDTEPYDFSGFNFYATEQIKDVLWIGDCDMACMKLAELLGWAEELRMLANIPNLRQISQNM